MSSSANEFDGSVVAVNRNALRDAVSAQLEGKSAEQIDAITDFIVGMADAPPLGPDGALHQINGTENGDATNAIARVIEAAQRNLTNGHHVNGANGATASSDSGSRWDASGEEEPVMSPNSRAILENRYLARNADNEVIEDPRGLFERVSRAVSQGEVSAGGTDVEAAEWAGKFYRVMSTFKFLPNSPTLVNAGKDGRGSLSACFVVSPKDDMASIMKVASDAAMIEKWGGGIGFGFSGLRPKGDPIATTHGMACGPVAVMKLYSAVGATLTQGAFRLGAHMGQLSVRHPDVLEFIHAKDDDNSIQNFNISVQVTDDFMRAVEADADWDLISPKDDRVTDTVKARDLWSDICNSAWKTGDPGLVFMDRVWETQPNPQLGLIETSNPCGEEFLENYGNCCLGSIDLAKHLTLDKTGFDWTALEDTVRTAVRFLDDVIEINTFPLAELREMNLKTRRIGLGIMGWADALVDLTTPYDSEQALDLARKVGRFIRETAWSESEKLAAQRGPFPEYENSRLKEQGMPPVRHSSVTTIAPTGTISRLADCSSGIEPHFALAWWSNILWEDHEGTSTRFLDAPLPVRRALVADVGEETAEETLAQLANDPAWRDEVVSDLISNHGVRTAMAIDPDWHVNMQAAWQENTTNSVSKTINLANDATVEDIAKAFWDAWTTQCKAITVYRDGSKSMQVLETGASGGQEEAESGDVHRIPRQRPQSLESITDRVRTGHGNLYVTITFENGRPFEVFTNLGKAGSSDAAYLEAVSRLASLALRSGVGVEQVIDQLRGITDAPTWDEGQQVLSAPDAVALALLRHARPVDEERDEMVKRARETFGEKFDLDELGEAHQDAVVQSQLFAGAQTSAPRAVSQPQCPDCYGTLIFTEGCMMCLACGYSKC